MIPKEGLDIHYIKAAFRRRLWYVVLPFFLVSTAAVIYCIKAPKMYLSTSLILIQPQEVPREYVRPTVTSNVQFRLNAITDEIMSRSRLEKIIERLDVYPQSRATGSMQDAVERMRRHIEVTSKKSGQRGSLTSFQVSFEAQDASMAKDVTDALTDLFIHYNFKLRQEQAAGTSKFLERELTRMRDELRQKEELVGQFRKQYRGMLPEEIENNYRILAQLQQHLDSINTSLQKTEDRRVLLRTQFSELEKQGTDSDALGNTGKEPYDLNELHRKLQKLKLRYNERHPDIIRLETLIAKLENEEDSTSPGSDVDEYDLSSHFNTAHRFKNSGKDRLAKELNIIDTEIKSLRNEKEKTLSKIDMYHERIEQAPKVQQMFVDLRRDYQMASKNYQSLLEKKLQAELAENLERTQKGEQFKILDKANLPRKPTSPNIPKILSMGFMLALGCGLGLAFVREFLDPTFWSRKDLESVLELPVLVSVPEITTDRERRWNRFRLIGGVCVMAIMSSALLYALFLLWRKNPTLLPL